MISISQTKEWFAQDSFFFCQELKKEEVSCVLSMYVINITCACNLKFFPMFNDIHRNSLKISIPIEIEGNSKEIQKKL